MEFAQRIRQIPPSATLALNAKANQLKAQGVDVVNFGVGEPDFDTPANIREAAIRAINDGFTRYTPVGGIPELKDAIIKTFQDSYGLAYKPGEIMVSCGGKHALYNLFQVIFDQGDEVVVPAPFWVSYPPMLMLAEATPVIIPTREENGFKLTAAELKAKLTPKTKGLILNSPYNPTGMVYTKAELETLAEVILAHKLLVVSDDLNYRILFDGASFVNLAMLSPELKAQTFVLNGVSDLCHDRLAHRLCRRAGAGHRHGGESPDQSTSNPTSISQKASVEALNGPQDTVAAMVKEFAWRRDDVYRRVMAIPGLTSPKPGGAFYIFPNFSAYYDRIAPGPGQGHSQALAEYLLDEAQVAAVPGTKSARTTAYGCPLPPPGNALPPVSPVSRQPCRSWGNKEG